MPAILGGRTPGPKLTSSPTRGAAGAAAGGGAADAGADAAVVVTAGTAPDAAGLAPGRGGRAPEVATAWAGAGGWAPAAATAWAGAAPDVAGSGLSVEEGGSGRALRASRTSAADGAAARDGRSTAPSFLLSSSCFWSVLILSSYCCLSFASISLL